MGVSLDSALDDEIIIRVARNTRRFPSRLDAHCAIPERGHADSNCRRAAIEFLLEDPENLLLDSGTDGEIIDCGKEFDGLCRNSSEVNRRYPDTGIDDDDQALRFALVAARDS